MYETFDHTADVGVRVSAPDLAGLFREAARGLLSLLVEDVHSVNPVQRVTIKLQEADREYLLFDWLRELLYLYDAQQFLTCEADVELGANGWTATVQGETADPARHRLAHEVKAITSHGLKLEQLAEGYQAEFIVDI